MKIGLKWVHMARYGLILRLERALWLPIIFKPLDPKRGYKNQKKSKKVLKSVPNQPSRRVVFVKMTHIFAYGMDRSQNAAIGFAASLVASMAINVAIGIQIAAIPAAAQTG